MIIKKYPDFMGSGRAKGLIQHTSRDDFEQKIRLYAKKGILYSLIYIAVCSIPIIGQFVFLASYKLITIGLLQVVISCILLIWLKLPDHRKKASFGWLFCIAPFGLLGAYMIIGHPGIWLSLFVFWLIQLPLSGIVLYEIYKSASHFYVN